MRIRFLVSPEHVTPDFVLELRHAIAINDDYAPVIFGVSEMMEMCAEAVSNPARAVMTAMRDTTIKYIIDLGPVYKVWGILGRPCEGHAEIPKLWCYLLPGLI
jgi:hypothetical protein